MGGLADIGRARPFSSLTGGLLENAQGLYRTQMSMDQMAQQRRSQDIQDRLNTMKLNEAQAASDRENQLVDIDDIPTKFASAGQGEFGKTIHGYIKATGATQEITSPDGSKKYFVRKGDIKDALNEYPKIMDKYPDFAKSMLWSQYSDSNTQLEALQGKLAKAKPEEADALKQQIDAAKGKRDQAIKAYNAFQGKDKAEEPFTLSPGQKRFDASGKEIATGGEKEPASDFAMFAEAGRAQGWDNKKISDEWYKRQLNLSSQKSAIIMQEKSKMIDVPSLADAVANGQDARKSIKGSMGIPVASQVQTAVLKKYPKFDFGKSDANYNWQNNPGNQRTISMIEGALPRVSMLAEQVKALGNTDIPKINEVMRVVSRETGKPEYTNFEANRNAIVQEINTALSGSATGSDMRVRIELENIQSARSPAQIVGAINNLNEALLSRLDTSLSVPFPIEVVQGKKSMTEYKQELFNKYRGKFSNGNDSSGTAVVEERTLKNGEVWQKLSDGTFKKVK